MSEWITHRLPTEADLSVDGDVLIPCKVTGFNGEVLPGESVANVNGAKIPVGQRWWPGNAEARKAAVAEQEAAAATAAANPDPTPKQTPDPSAEPSPAVAGVPSDEELWGLRFSTLLNANPELVATTWDAARSLVFGHAHIKANRALYDYGYRRCLEEAKATSELNSELTRDLTLLQEENAQLKSTVDELVSETHVLDRRLNNAAREIEYKERHLDGAYRRIKELERELERRDAESESEPAPAPDQAGRKVVQIAGHSNALSVMCDDGTVWLWTSYDGWTPYKTIPQTPIQ